MVGRGTTLKQRRLRRRSLLGGTAVGLASLAAGTLSGCAGKQAAKPAARSGAPTTGTQPPGGSPQMGGTLAAPQAGNSPNLDPQRTSSFYTLDPAGAVYSRLLRFKSSTDVKVAESHEVQADLALSAESPDVTTWTVKLRPGAKYQNIAPVSAHAVEAEDIKATFARALDPQNPGRGALEMIDPDQIETPAKDTAVFKLKYPFGLFQLTLAAPADSYIFPREALAGTYDPSKQMIGSGPFLLDNYTPDVAFTFKRNPEWFGKPAPFVDGVRWAIAPDPAQWRAQFTGGHLDVLQGPGIVTRSEDLPSLRQDNPKALVIRSDPGGAQILFFKLDDPASPFRDLRARQAFSLAIDRDAIAKAIYNNDAEPQFYVFLNQGKWALHVTDLLPDTAQYYKFDLQKAKQLLQASGTADQEFKLLYVRPYLGPAYERAAQTIANMLANAGVKITAVQVDYQKDYVGGGKGIRFGNYDKNSVVFAGTGDFTNVDQSLAEIYSSKAAVRLSRPEDPTIDSMLSKARAQTNEADRVKNYLDLQKYLAGKMYTVAGFPQPYVYTLVGQRVQNFLYTNSNALATETFANLWLKG